MNQSALATSHARLIPDPMATGQKKVDKCDWIQKLVQGKVRAKVLLNETVKYQTQMNTN